MSKPLMKDFSSEALIKVKLDFWNLTHFHPPNTFEM
jgi:hypothetical protein